MASPELGKIPQSRSRRVTGRFFVGPSAQPSWKEYKGDHLARFRYRNWRKMRKQSPEAQEAIAEGLDFPNSQFDDDPMAKEVDFIDGVPITDRVVTPHGLSWFKPLMLHAVLIAPETADPEIVELLIEDQRKGSPDGLGLDQIEIALSNPYLNDLREDDYGEESFP